MSDNANETSVGSKAKLRAFIALGIFLAIGLGLFLLNPADRYLWVKTLHVIAVISWMAGMLYLPRLFVYHADSEIGSSESETFKVMERRLLKVIMTPAMIITWVLGFWLGWAGGLFPEVWFSLKMLAVLAMSGCHGFFSAAVRKFANDQNVKLSSQWRLYNEIPTVLMIIIVMLVIVKPF